MAEFDDKLNSILSNPDAMSQIMQLAQSLSGPGPGQEAPPSPPPPPPQQTAAPPPMGGQRDSNARALLYALRPYLKEEKQSKVERALQLARLFHLGKKFLSGWEG